MDGIIGLGHFCETHGPCVILSTQRTLEEPKQQLPHNLSVTWCESCQSIDVDQCRVSKDGKTFYVTSRTPLEQDLSFLLKQAVVRSLSCEETSKEGGTMYFGDSERGHVLSHTFALQDSLARGFQRKYSILILNRDKIHLLNSWPILTRNIKEIARELQMKAAKINNLEQSQCSQRVVRQTQASPSSPRSLSQLTGEPAVFAHLHMSFTWLLSIEPIIEKSNHVPEISAYCSPTLLKTYYNEMGEKVFRTVCYCILTGIRVYSENKEVLRCFKQLLPTKWGFPTTGELCCLNKNQDGIWVVNWIGNLPPKLPKLQQLIEEALKNETMADSALEPYLTAAILRWHNTARVLSGISTPNQALFQVLGVQNSDLPLLAYWTAQCRHELRG